MTIYLLILIISGTTVSLLGGLVYLRNPKSQMGRYFLLLCLSATCWATVHYYVDHADTLEVSLIFAKAAAAAAFNGMYWMLLFSTRFQHKPPRWSTLKFVLPAWLIGSVFSASGFVFNSATQGVSIVNIGHGPGYMAYLLILIALFSTAIWQLISAKKKSSVNTKTQINYILFGLSLTFGIAIVNNGILPLVYDNWWALKYTSVMALFFVGSVSYAIIKHRLFDIRFVIARTVAYTALLTILAVVYTGSLFGIGLIFNRSDTSIEQVVINTVLALVVAATFQPLKSWLETVTNKLFYKGDYSSDELISSITSIMAETLELKRLTADSMEKIMETLHVEYGSFWVAEASGFNCLIAKGKHVDIANKLSNDLLEQLGRSEHIMVLEEDEDSSHRRMLQQTKTTVAVPLSAGDILQGVMLLGPKKSGEVYTEKDLNMLRILGPGLATALENARSYKQISEFNFTLEREVDRATTDLKRVNEKLSRNNDKLRQLDKLKDEFISVTSHELRTPLTAIRGYIWMAMHGKNKDKSFDDYMSRAYLSTERLITMVNDTLDVSRIESGRMKFSPEPTDLNKLTQEVIDNLSAKALQQHQALILKKTRSLPLVECDPDKVYQVLTNLVGNAIKFSPAGGEILVDFKLRGGEVITRVKDNGPGISIDDQKRLFQKFSRLESATSIPGTGLGLYLCQRIIKLSGGRIWIESDAGQGAAFLFTLKVSKHQKAPVQKRRPQQFRNVSAA